MAADHFLTILQVGCSQAVVSLQKTDNGLFISLGLSRLSKIRLKISQFQSIKKLPISRGLHFTVPTLREMSKEGPGACRILVKVAPHSSASCVFCDSEIGLID